MMGVYIKGMKMPKKCLWCPLQYIGFCQVTKTDVNSDLGRRADDCPIVEVPEPHGRLIDVDEICFSMTNGTDQDIAEEAIRESTTVIEADGE